MRITFYDENNNELLSELIIDSVDIDIDEKNNIVTMNNITQDIVVNIQLFDWNPDLNSSKKMIDAIKIQVRDRKDISIILSPAKRDINLKGKIKYEHDNEEKILSLDPCNVSFEYKKDGKTLLII